MGTRLGRRGSLTVLGGVLSYEEVTYPGALQLTEGRDYATRTPVDSTVVREVAPQTRELGSIRLGAVLGQRNVWWVKKRGLDSMRGQQDVPLGADVTFVFARSLAALERDNDLVAMLLLYTAVDAGTALFAGRIRLDARRDFEAPASAPEWQDVYGEIELLNYWKPTSLPRHTFFARAAAAGA